VPPAPRQVQAKDLPAVRPRPQRHGVAGVLHAAAGQRQGAPEQDPEPAAEVPAAGREDPRGRVPEPARFRFRFRIRISPAESVRLRQDSEIVQVPKSLRVLNEIRKIIII
jgi:hypothetical protein